jgi:Flp pilus assembly protein TadD
MEKGCASTFSTVAQRFSEAVRCQQLGKLAEAVAIYDDIISLSPNISAIHNNRGVALAGLERFADAAAAYRRSVQLNPNNAEALNNLGSAFCELGRLDEAERALQSAVKLNPRWARFRTNLGVVLKCQGKLDEAEAAHREAVALDPWLAEAHNNLGDILCRLNRLEDAESVLRRAICLDPRHAGSFLNLATTLRAKGGLSEAEVSCRHAIALKPRFASAHNLLGTILSDLGRFEEAEKSLRHAIVLRSRFAEAMSNLGNVLREQGRSGEAEAAYRQAIAFKPDMAEAYYNLGLVLTDQHKLVEAEAAYRRAIALKEGFADAHNNLGATLKFLGHFDEARRSVGQALQLLPRDPSYLLNLGELKTFDSDDPDLATLEALTTNIESLPINKQIDLHFALAKAYDDLGHREGTINHLLAGNALKRSQTQYDEARTLRRLERIVEVFTPELMRAFAGAGEPSSVPVFIVGMPRSGTTLIEQILASHPQVFAGGELSSLNALAADIITSDPRPRPFPDAMTQISRHDLQRIGARYVSELAQLAPGATRITDKMPSNFQFVGLIHLMLPNARIIHAVRDPLDTCFSCFSKLFVHQDHTYDLAELGRYYRQYQRVVEHWRVSLPAARILDVRYEDVVTDLEGQARRIIAYCDLEWDDCCLAFHKTDRPVHTASTMQVRQPIYRTAMGRAQRYEAFLRPLLDALSSLDDMVSAFAA